MGLGAIGAFTAAWRPAVTGTDFQKTARKKQWDTGVSDKERPHNQAQVDTPSTLSDPSHTNHAALRHSRSPGKFAGQGCPQCCGSLYEGFGPHFHRPGGFSRDVCPGLRFSCAGRGCEESGCWVPGSSPTVPGLYPAAGRFPPIFPHLVSCYSWECLLADDLSQCVFQGFR